MMASNLAAIGKIVSCLGESSFPTDLLSFLREKINFDSSIIMAYPGEGKLQVVWDALQAKDREVFNSKYRGY